MAERLVAATGHFFDRQATFKKFLFFEGPRFCRFGFAELADEFRISFFVERAVDKVRRFAFFPAVHVECMVKVDAVRFNDGGDGVKEMQTVTAEALENIVGKSITCQRPCGHKRRAVAFEARHFFAVERDVRKFRNFLFDKFAKNIAVHGEGIACRNRRFAGAVQQKTPEQREFRF